MPGAKNRDSSEGYAHFVVTPSPFTISGYSAALLSKPLPDWNAMEIPLDGLSMEGVDVR